MNILLNYFSKYKLEMDKENRKNSPRLQLQSPKSCLMMLAAAGSTELNEWKATPCGFSLYITS